MCRHSNSMILHVNTLQAGNTVTWRHCVSSLQSVNGVVELAKIYTSGGPSEIFVVLRCHINLLLDRVGCHSSGCHPHSVLLMHLWSHTPSPVWSTAYRFKFKIFIVSTASNPARWGHLERDPVSWIRQSACKKRTWPWTNTSNYCSKNQAYSSLNRPFW